MPIFTLISPFKVIQKTQAGKAGFSDVKTLIIKCTDFRTIRLTFIKGKIITKADSQPVLDVAENEIESEEEEESTARESFCECNVKVLLSFTSHTRFQS